MKPRVQTMTTTVRKNYHTGLLPKTRRGPSAAKLQAKADVKKALAKTPPDEPTTVKEALAQMVAANRACREEDKISRPATAKRVFTKFLWERRQETINNLFNVIDPDPEEDD